MKEVPFYDFDTDWREISAPPLPPPQSPARFLCDSKKAGSAPVHLSTLATTAGKNPLSSFLTWCLDVEQEGVVEILELSPSQRFPVAAFRLRTSSPVVSCFIVPSGDAPSRIVAVTAVGAVCTLNLERSSSSAGGGALEVAGEVEVLDVSWSLARTEGVTAVTVSPIPHDLILFAGGQNGIVTCIPLHPSGPSFDLREGDPMLRRIFGGILTGAKSAAPVTALCVRMIKDVMLLFVCHADGAMRVWDVDRRQRLLAQEISSASSSGLVASTIEVEMSASSDVALIALVCNVEDAQSGGTVFVYALDVQPLELEKPILTSFNIVRRFPVDPQTFVADVRLVRDEVWMLLTNESGRHSVERQDLGRDGIGGGGCVLLEDEISEILLQSDDDDVSWKDLLFALQFLLPDQQEGVEASTALESLFLDRLLSPLAFDRLAIQRTLEVWGRQLSTADTSSLSLDSIRTEISAAVHSKARSGKIGEEIRRWWTFCRDYVKCRHELQEPLCFLTDASSGAVGLLRSGAATVFRHLEPVEYIFPSGEGEELSLPEEWHLSEENESVLRQLASCGRDLSCHLGQLACAALEADLLLPHGGSSQGLLPKLLPVLQLGYSSSGAVPAGDPLVGSEMARARDNEARSSQRAFPLQVTHQLASLSSVRGLGAREGWAQALGLLEGYLGHLVAPLPALPAVGGGADAESAGVPGGGVAVGRAASLAVCQVARARYEAARDAVLLLSHISSTWAQVGMSSGDLERVQVKLLPQARQVLTENLLLMWISTAFSTPPRVRAADDFSSQLSALHIADERWQSRADARHGLVIDRTLVEVLLGAILERRDEANFISPYLTAPGLLSPAHITAAVSQLVSVLRWGASGIAAQSGEEGFQWRAAQLALLFLETFQYDALQVLLLAIERSLRDGVQLSCGCFGASSGGGETAVLSFLLGFVSLACAKTTTLKRARLGNLDGRSAHIARAMRFFFRAAASMDAGDDSLFDVLVKHFNGNAVSQPHLPGGERASRKLQYYEVVMLIFERYNEREGACQFAHAALEQGDIAATEQADVGMIIDYEEIVSLKGRLWSNVFKFSLDLGCYHEAYSAIVSNPDPETKRVCLRRFVIVLCERSAAQVLCGNELPYAGLLEKVEQELIWKAEGCDIRAKPSPYKLLYCFHAARMNWRRASTTMYRYSLRIAREKLAKDNQQRTVALAAMQEHVESLGVAVTALQLVDPVNAWLDLRPFSPVLPELPSPNKRPRFGTNNSNPGMGDPEENSVTEYVVTLQDMQKEFALASARLHLARSQPNKPLPGGGLVALEFLGLLIEAQLYDRAFSIAFLFWTNTSLQSELERIFEAMTRRACYLQMQANDPNPLSHNGADVAAGRGTVSLLLSSKGDDNHSQSEKRHLAAPELWQQLQSYLERYDGLHSKLRVVVAETILDVDARMQLPLWLTSLFKGASEGTGKWTGRPAGDTSALLRIYLDHGLLPEATALTLDLLHSAASQRHREITPKQSCATWLPYSLIDRLQRQLDIASNDDTSASARWNSHLQQLSQALSTHFDQVKRDTSDAKERILVS